MPRILFISCKPYYPWEGACHRMRHTVEAIAASEKMADFLTVPFGSPPQIKNVVVHSVPRPPFFQRLPDRPSVRRLIIDTLILFKAVHLATRTHYDLIHGCDDGGVIAWITGRLTKTPCVFERLADAPHARAAGPRRGARWLYRRLERQAIRHADAVIGNDHTIIQILARLNRRSRGCVIPDIPAITEDVPQPARNLAQARYRTQTGQSLVTCVGSDTRLQGLDLFFNAIPHALAGDPLMRFVVVGGSEAEIVRMRKALAKAGIEQNVTFTGRIPPDELAALFSVSNVLVSPRRAGNTTPIKVLDYLHSGVPIVAADTPANRVLLSADNAVITRPTPRALAEGILKLCKAPHVGAELADQGKNTLVRENRTPESFRTALTRCYAYVLATP